MTFHIWNPDLFPLPDQAVFDRERQQIAAVSRSSSNLDLFVIGFDNHVWSTFWGPREPMTLDVRVDQSSPTVPLHIGLHIGGTSGIVTETNWTLSKNNVLLPEFGHTVLAGMAFDDFLNVGDPGTYVFTVNRTGLEGPAGLTTLTRTFTQVALATPPPPPPPEIEVSFSGSIAAARFHITGHGFLPNRPRNNHGVAIRVVDMNILIETRREFTASSSVGTIDHEIVGDLTGLTLNAAGVATVAISATDGRPGPEEFLWSNTVRTDFRP